MSGHSWEKPASNLVVPEAMMGTPQKALLVLAIMPEKILWAVSWLSSTTRGSSLLDTKGTMASSMALLDNIA